MKKLRILLAMMAVLAGVAVVSSCSDSDDDDPRLETDKTSTGLTFAADATTAQIINVTSDVTGTISAVPKDNWAYAVVNGKAISVTVGANTGAERTTNITISANGFRSVDVKVTQAAGGASALISVSPRTYAFPKGGETKEFTVTTELTGITVEYTGDAGITVDSYDDSKITVTATENTAEAGRSGKLVISHSDLTSNYEVTLTQAGNAIEYYTITNLAGFYMGDTPAGTSYAHVQAGVSDNNMLIFWPCVSKRAFADFKLDAGEYPVADTYAAKTVKKYATGTASYVMNADRALVYTIESGTMTVEVSGTTTTLTMVFQAKDVSDNSDVSLAYKYTGEITYQDETGGGGPTIPQGDIAFNDIPANEYTMTGTPVVYSGGDTPEEPTASSWSGGIIQWPDDEVSPYYTFTRFSGDGGPGFFINWDEDKTNIYVDHLGIASITVQGTEYRVRMLPWVQRSATDWAALDTSTFAVVPTYNKTTKTLDFAQKATVDGTQYDVYMALQLYDTSGKSLGRASSWYKDCKAVISNTPYQTSGLYSLNFAKGAKSSAPFVISEIIPMDNVKTVRVDQTIHNTIMKLK